MLADDPEDRWTLDDLEAWVRGSRQTSKAYRSQRHASRPFTFADKDYLFVPSLVYALVRNWSKAGEVIRNKSLDSWLRRSLSDDKLADDVSTTINPSGPTSRNIPDDVLISRTCIALDKDGPLRFRSFAGKIEGLGVALAMAQGDNERISLIMQILQSKLAISWLNFQGREYKNFNSLTIKFEMLPLLLDHKQPGFGFERALYELNPHMPCLSPILKDHYITTPQELLTLFDRMGASGNHPTMPFDRHIAAFLAARMSEAKDSDFRPLGPPADQATQILGQLNLLVKMQRVCRSRELHGLTSWVIKMIHPVINKYRNVKRRKRITDAIMASSKSGLIADMVQYANNETELALDEHGFKRAAIEHAVITMRISGLEQMQRQQVQIAKRKGEQAALTLASILALFFMTALFYLSIKSF